MTAIPNGWRTLVDVCRHHARARPASMAYAWLDEREVEVASRSFAELDRRARVVAVALQQRGLAGGRALLLYRPGLAFVDAFLGCLYAGVTAVPAYAPRPREGVERLARVAADADVAAVLTEQSMCEALAAECATDPRLAGAAMLATDALDADPGAWTEPSIDASTLAFLQYTSGSTGTPKGVEVSHGNLLANEAMIQAGFDHSEQTVFVGWLPLHHDMGLVGNVLQPLYLGIPSVLMAPETFIQKPIRWLRAISRYRATTSGGPNFGYELCVRRSTPEERASLDLSSWRVAYNGAEPIRADTLARFEAAFRPHGLAPEAMFPCYGMAEASLFVTGGPASARSVVVGVDGDALESHRVEAPQPAGPARQLVGCGRRWLDCEVLVVDPDTLTPYSADRVGEIWVSGPHVAQGYRNQPELTAATFRARLATGEGPFLRTGDLGFLRDGELFVTGRLKDLVILSGRNHYPQDIELTVSAAHPSFRADGTAAFVVEEGGEERLVIVQEIDRQHLRAYEAGGEALRAELLRIVRRAVADAHGIRVHDALFLRHGRIPKTSSGKIRRRASKQLYLAGPDGAVGSAWVEPAA